MKNNTVIKFLLRSVAFLLLLVLVDRLTGAIFKKIYFSQKVGQFSQTTYAIDSARQDIMIFGSSRAVRHYSPDIISSRSGLSCYDAGRDGLMIPYSTAMEEVSLTRHKPKLIILDITPRELGIDKTKYERLTILLPYCFEHSVFLRYISEVSRLEKYKLLSKTYPYNSSIFILATNSFFSKSVEKDDKGYLPLKKSMTPEALREYVESMAARSFRTHQKADIPEIKAVSYFREFLDNTARNHIQTMVVISPTIISDTFDLDNQMKERDLIANITAKYPNVVFLDYSKDPRFNYHPEKFNDVFHLNKRGSQEFSNIIAGYIKQNFTVKKQQPSIAAGTKNKV